MQAVSYTNFRQNMRSVINKVYDDAERMVITTKDNKNIVVMSQVDYESWQETLYLLGSSNNRDNLEQSINDLENGDLVSFIPFKE